MKINVNFDIYGPREYPLPLFAVELGDVSLVNEAFCILFSVNKICEFPRATFSVTLAVELSAFTEKTEVKLELSQTMSLVQCTDIELVILTHRRLGNV